MTNTNTKTTEISAMEAWIATLEKNQPQPYVASGVPVKDPSSQADEILLPKDANQAADWGLIHR